MRLEDYINSPEWQGPVQVEEITEEILQENPEWTIWGTLPGDLHLFDGTGLEMWIHPHRNGHYSLVGGGE